MAAEFARLGADFDRVFSPLPHGSRPRVPPTRGDIQASADRTAAQMAGVPRADFSLFPTLTPHCFLALASLDAPSPSAGLVHAEPSASPSGEATWELACRKVRRRRLKVTIGSIDPLITASLRAAGGDLPVWDMPIPLDGRFKAAYSSEAKTIGFFGHQRRERGLDLLPSLVRRLLASGYRVVLHDTAGHFGAGDVRPRLRLLTFVEDLSAEMTSCDVVVCPMEASRYEHRHSGIVWSAVASGVPVVVPKGTLSAVRISRWRSSSCYREHSVEGIMSAILRVASNYPSFAAAAARGALLWKKKHGVDRFVQSVLDHLDK